MQCQFECKCYGNIQCKLYIKSNHPLRISLVHLSNFKAVFVCTTQYILCIILKIIDYRKGDLVKNPMKMASLVPKMFQGEVGWGGWLKWGGVGRFTEQLGYRGPPSPCAHSTQWQIQDFPWVGAPSSYGGAGINSGGSYISKILNVNAKESGPLGAHAGSAPWNRQCYHLAIAWNY